MKKTLVMVLAMIMALGTAVFADDEVFVRGQGMGQQLEGEALETFQSEMLEEKQSWIDDLVEAGKITLEEGQNFMTEMEENMASCDGNPSHLGQGLKLGNGEGFGAMSGNRQGNGNGTGTGSGNRMGHSNGRWQSK